MTIIYASQVVLFAAWLMQFIAWRREAVARQQLELQVEKLQALATMRRHPAVRNRPLPGWAREMEGDADA